MASKKSNIDVITDKTRELSLHSATPKGSTTSSASQTLDYYLNRKPSAKITFARLEKGLLLFIYVYETSKVTLRPELALWSRQICVNTIREGQCSKPADQCRREHQTNYRQNDLCPYWYISDGCTFGKKCKNVHQFSDIDKYHQWIRTPTDYDVYRLIRFVRNFAGHFIDSVINDEQSLYKDLIIAMVHLVHYLSPKHSQAGEHLHLFLEKTTIDQLIPTEDLLKKLAEPFDVPQVFFELHFDFNTNWYPDNRQRRSIDFNELSPGFVEYFKGIFVSYFRGRLKSRGASQAWP